MPKQVGKYGVLDADMHQKNVTTKVEAVFAR